MKTTLDLAQWLPDQAALGLPGATVAKNVYAAARGYLQADSLAAYTDALGAACRGVFAAQASTGDRYMFAGTLTKLYSTVGRAWTDATNTIKDYEVASTKQWEFAQFGDYVVATAYFDGAEASASAVTVPQVYQMGTSSDFANLYAAPYAYWRAAHCATVRDFIMYGDIDNAGTRYPNRIWWTALGDHTSIAPSAVTQADYQDLYETGWVMQILGGEKATILCQYGVWLATYIGTPTIWQLDLILPNIGTHFPWGCTKWGDITYFISPEGFCALTDGGALTRIGAERVDRYFFESLKQSSEHQVWCVADPRNKRIVWAYPTTAAAADTSDAMLVYDIVLDRWTLVEQTVETISQANTAGVSLDEMTVSASAPLNNIDLIPISFDSDWWRGGKPLLVAVDTAHKLGVFAGTPLAATVETQEGNLGDGKWAIVRNTRPLVDDGTATVAIGSRNRQTDTVTWEAAASMRTSGICNHRVNARYHRGRIQTTGAFGYILGLEVDYDPTGGR